MNTIPWKITLALLALSVASMALPVHAQISTPSTLETLQQQALWEVQLHPQKLFASRLGTVFNELIVSKAPDGENTIDAFVEALGFDPRSSLQEVMVFGDNFSETAPRVVANLGSSSGNLEGWLLAAPGYESEVLEGDVILHSFVHEGKHGRIWCALPTRAADGNRFLVAGFDRGQVIDLVSSVREGSTAPLSNQLAGTSVLSISVNDLTKLPLDIDGDNPGAAIVSTIKGLTFTANAESSGLVTNCQVTAENPARAEQIQQLLAGMKAMGQLALSKEKAPEKEQVIKALQNVQVNYEKGSKNVSASMNIDYGMIEDLINKKVQ